MNQPVSMALVSEMAVAARPPLIPMDSGVTEYDGLAGQQRQSVQEDTWPAVFQPHSQVSRFDSARRITEMMDNLITQQLPTLLDFSGEEPSTAGAFTDWIEHFEMMAELAQ